MYAVFFKWRIFHTHQVNIRFIHFVDGNNYWNWNKKWKKDWLHKVIPDSHLHLLLLCISIWKSLSNNRTVIMYKKCICLLPIHSPKLKNRFKSIKYNFNSNACCKGYFDFKPSLSMKNLYRQTETGTFIFDYMYKMKIVTKTHKWSPSNLHKFKRAEVLQWYFYYWLVSTLAVYGTDLLRPAHTGWIAPSASSRRHLPQPPAPRYPWRAHHDTA